MPTLVLDPQPVQMAQLIERRRRLGQDPFDEVWNGVLHMNPVPAGRHARVEAQLMLVLQAPAAAAGLTIVGQFNLGDDDHDRVPDGGLHRDRTDRVWYPTAAVVLEILSPGDETFEKLPFYAAHKVDEVVIVDPERRKVEWLALGGDAYGQVQRTGVTELGAAELERHIDWP